MKQFAVTLVLTCALSGSAMAGTIPTMGAPVPGEIPMVEANSVGQIPSDGSPAPGDMPTCGLSILKRIFDLAF